MLAWAVVVAAGSGTRFGGPKQFADLGGRPVAEWSLDVARRACSGAVLVVPTGALAPDVLARQWAAEAVVFGGATRSESVRAGLAAVPADAEVIVVHDAARPLASPELWRGVIAAVEEGADAAIPAVAVRDTVKERTPDGRLLTLDRSRLVAVQTPQAFRADVLRAAHRDGGDATDDAALVEAAGGKVVLVEGCDTNLKVTAPTDLVVAAALLAAREDG